MLHCFSGFALDGIVTCGPQLVLTYFRVVKKRVTLFQFKAITAWFCTWWCCNLFPHSCLIVFALWKGILHSFDAKQLSYGSALNDFVICCHTRAYLHSNDEGACKIVSTRNIYSLILHLVMFFYNVFYYSTSIFVHFITNCINAASFNKHLAHEILSDSI